MQIPGVRYCRNSDSAGLVWGPGLTSLQSEEPLGHMALGAFLPYLCRVGDGRPTHWLLCDLQGLALAPHSRPL